MIHFIEVDGASINTAADVFPVDYNESPVIGILSQ